MRPMLAALLMLVPAAAFADTPPAAPPKEKKICRAEASTGSYFVKRTCHTKAEWEAIDNANQRDTDNFRNRRDNTAPRG